MVQSLFLTEDFVDGRRARRYNEHEFLEMSDDNDLF